MASVTPMGIRMRRSTHILDSVPLSTSSSSLRVPDLLMSMAGKVRLSASLRSSMISELPVPLNSSKMTSSMRLPVSISAVAMIVRRAAFLDVARRAEEPLRPLQGVGVDTAGQDLARRRHHGVVGARQAGDGIQQDHHVRLCSTRRLAFSITISATCTWRAGRLVEGREITSPFTTAPCR
jgi:hypothetical protein